MSNWSLTTGFPGYSFKPYEWHCLGEENPETWTPALQVRMPNGKMRKLRTRPWTPTDEMIRNAVNGLDAYAEAMSVIVENVRIELDPYVNAPQSGSIS